MKNEMKEKIEKLVLDKEYMEHLLSLGSAEEISKELEKEDIEISPDELRKIYDLAKKKEAGELSDEELEEVSGGMMAPIFFVFVVLAACGYAGAGIGIGKATSKC